MATIACAKTTPSTIVLVLSNTLHCKVTLRGRTYVQSASLASFCVATRLTVLNILFFKITVQY